MKTMGRALVSCAFSVLSLSGCVTTGGGISDEDRIRRLVDDTMTALQEQDIDAMMKSYAASFESDQPGGREGIKKFFDGAKERGFLDGLRVDLGNMKITVNGKKASAKPIGLQAQFGALIVELELEEIEDKWMITYQTQY